MKLLRISDELALPLEAVTETFGLLAVRGAGKSNAARVMAEEMFKAGLPFVAVDPVGSWRGLRAARDGQGAGLPIPIFGGRWGDVPLERGGGHLLADLVVDQRLSCVLDLTTLDSEASKKTFLLDFARRLYQRNEEPLHLFLEEADDYIPQRPMRDEAQLLRAWENIVRRGRSRGLGCTLITQRSAAIAKDVLTQVQTLIAMRTTGPQDVAAVAAWLKYHAQGEEILESLATLKAGEAWVWSPVFLGKTERIRFRLSSTFDSGATPKSGGGAQAKAAATLADVDLADIQKRMTATIERAKAEDPRELRKEIAVLKLTIQAQAVLAKEISDDAKMRQSKTVEVPVLKDKDTRRLAAVARILEHRAEKATAAAQAMQEAAGVVRAAQLELDETLKRLNRPATQTPPHGAGGPGPRPVNPPAHPPPSATAAPEQRILDGLAQLEVLGVPEPERVQVAFLAGYTNLTSNIPTRPSTPSELQDRVLELLGGVHGRVLKPLIEIYPGSIERAELGARAGYTNVTSKGFVNALGRLRSLGFVTYPSNGIAAAAPLLFLEEGAR